MNGRSTTSAAPGAQPPAVHDTQEDATRVPGDAERFLRTELLDRLSHELRGPAGVSLGALEELELALGSTADAHQALLLMLRRNLRKVLRTAERLTRASQLESGELQLTPASTDVVALVEKAAEEARRLEGRRTVEVVFELPRQPWLAELDASWVSPAVTELVAHAIRNARTQVRVELQCTESGVELHVRDDGSAAMSPPLRRFEWSNDRRDAGLCLPMVQDVARAHGGALTLSAAQPSGTLASLRLAVRAALEPPQLGRPRSHLA